MIEEVVVRRDEETKDKEDEEYQLNLAIQISNAEVKEKGIHIVKQWERIEIPFTTNVTKRKSKIEEEFKKKPPTQQELIEKMKGVAQEAENE